MAQLGSMIWPNLYAYAHVFIGVFVFHSIRFAYTHIAYFMTGRIIIWTIKISVSKTLWFHCKNL